MGEQRLYRDHRYELGQQLLMLRTRVALTQSALAAELGVHRRSVQNWETGISYPKAEMLQRLIAVFMHHHAFTPGQERAEAQALWSQAVQDGPHALPAFDEEWFAALHAGMATPNSQLPTPNSRPSMIDWGEAPAVPTLHGREREIATLHLRANLDVLASTLRDVPARHRSMRAVFDDSWNLLSVLERRYFSRLAVFRGGWTAAAATAVAEWRMENEQLRIVDIRDPILNSQFSILNLLASLVDKSLVLYDRAEQRFIMLEPIREYALEQLVAHGEAAAVQRAHADYYLALADAAAAHWDTPAGEADIAQLDREHDNMRAALQWARDGGDHTLGMLLAGALRKFWRRRGAISEGRSWLEDLLALDQTACDPTALANESVALFRAQKADASLAEVLITLGRIERALGHLVAAYAALTEALRLAAAVGPRLMVAAALELAGLALAQGHAEQATRLLAEATALRTQMGTPVRPADQAVVEQALVTARAALGDAAFESAWAAAAALPIEQFPSSAEPLNR